MTEEHSYNLAIEGIKSAGNCGADICSALSSIGTAGIDVATNVVSSAFGTVDKIIDNYQSSKMQKLQNELSKVQMAHEENMQKLQNEMQKEQLRHEEFIISEQRKVLEKMIEAASMAFNRKMDFLEKQLETLENTYARESELIAKDIQFLEGERRNCINDATKYALLSSDINKLEDSKSQFYTEYLKAKSNLTNALDIIKIDEKYTALLNDNQNKLLGK